MIDTIPSATTVINNFKSRHKAPFSIMLQFDDCRIRVRANVIGLIDALEIYFREFLGKEGRIADIEVTAIETSESLPNLRFVIKTPDPGKTKIKEEYIDCVDGRIVRKRLTGMIFVVGGGEHLAVGPCVDNDNQVINFVISRYIQWTLHRGGLLLHAAGVEKNGNGLALAGFSGMGKSTLALHLMSRGVTFVSNDRIMIRPLDNGQGVRMYGVPKLPRINPGTALNNPDLNPVIPTADQEQFRCLEGSALWDLERKYDVYIDEIFGSGKFVLSAAMKGLVVLNWKRDKSGAKPAIVTISQRPDLFPAFMKSTGLFFEAVDDGPPPDFSDAAYRALLEKTRVMEVAGGVDFDMAADACMKLLDKAQA